MGHLMLPVLETHLLPYQLWRQQKTQHTQQVIFSYAHKTLNNMRMSLIKSNWEWASELVKGLCLLFRSKEKFTCRLIFTNQTIVITFYHDNSLSPLLFWSGRSKIYIWCCGKCCCYWYCSHCKHVYYKVWFI